MKTYNWYVDGVDYGINMSNKANAQEARKKNKMRIKIKEDDEDANVQTGPDTGMQRRMGAVEEGPTKA